MLCCVSRGEQPLRGDKEARVRHDPITLCHLNHSCSGGAPLLRHRSPASGCRAKGEGASSCPLHWDAPPAPTVPLYLRSVLDRDVLGILSHPGPVQDNGGDLGVPGKLQLPHWGSTRYPSGGCLTCPGSVIYRPAPGLAAGREEERRRPHSCPQNLGGCAWPQQHPGGPRRCSPGQAAHTRCSTRFCYRGSCFCV